MTEVLGDTEHRRASGGARHRHRDGPLGAETPAETRVSILAEPSPFAAGAPLAA